MKSRSIRLTAVPLILAAVSGGATELKGRFVRNQAGGDPIAGVSVKADGANRTLSLERGNFTLVFPMKKPGDPATLDVEKQGLVVVNWVQLNSLLPADPDRGELTILLAEAKNREEMARRFFQLRGFEAIEAKYRSQLQQVNADRAGLQKQLEQAKAVATQTAEQLAKLMPGQTSKLFEDAMRLVAEGKLPDAIGVLDQAKLLKLADGARERKRQAIVEADKEIQQATDALLLRAKLLTTQFQFGDAERAYQLAVQNSPDSLDASAAYAEFSQDLHHNQAAAQEWERSLTLARAQTSPRWVVRVLTAIGILDQTENRFAEARKADNEALAIAEEQIHKDVDEFIPAAAGIRNNLGTLEASENHIDEALKQYNFALAIFRELARQAPESFRSDVAGTLDNLGLLYRLKNAMSESGKASGEALTIYRELAHDNPASYLPKVARALNGLGILYRSENRLDESATAYQESLGVFRQLAQTNPDTYLIEVAAELNNLGNVRRDQRRTEDARTAYQEALPLRRKLVEGDPAFNRPYLSETLNNLGVLALDERRPDQGRAFLEEALAIRRELASANPETYLPYLATTWNNLGNLHLLESSLDEARKAYEEAIRIRRQLASTNQLVYLPTVATTLNNLGILLRQQNDIEGARKAWQEAVDILVGFLIRAPGRYNRVVDQIRQQLADLPR